ncbi:MAG: pirin family protein, partial [Spirochaetaceae bacterium]|nr:pirin family protein [Spirochaetaceae bacterium]
GTIGPGELQWMTAGSGIIHEEMPQRSPRGVYGFQLWVNLPRAEKMSDPAYRGVGADEVPVVSAPGASVKVLAGSYGGRTGPVRGVARDPTYLDLGLDPRAEGATGGAFELEAPEGETAFAFVYEGSLRSAGAGPGGGAAPLAAGDCALFGPGDLVRLAAGEEGARLVFARGRPLRESVAWRGPIVMNTEEELDLAFGEYAAGTFVRKRG